MHQTSENTNFFKSMSGMVRTSCAAAALTLLGATSAMAVPVTYTFQLDLSQVNATMNGAAVSGPLTVTATGDTNNIQSTVADYSWASFTTSTISNLAYSFNLPGTGPFSMTSQFGIYSTVTNYSNGSTSLEFGFSTGDGGAFQFSLNSYDIGTAASAGPLATEAYDLGGNGGAWFWDDIGTTAGLFTIDNTKSNPTHVIPTIFTATVSNPPAAVPEPDSLALFGGAGVALLLAARRRKQAPKAA